MLQKKSFTVFLFLFGILVPAFAQQTPFATPIDSNENIRVVATDIHLDTTGKKKYSPKIAIVRSAIIPGWGQATNKKYWKIPLVYGALGTTTYLFFTRPS